jgi:pantoate--beta-alanine ligase
MEVAPILYRALSAAKEVYGTEGMTGEELVSRATTIVTKEQDRLVASDPDGVDLKVDYFEVFDKDTFEPVRGSIAAGRETVIAGAVWVGKTRLIDNLLLGWDM